MDLKLTSTWSAEIDQLIFRNYILQSLNHVEVNSKPQFLIKSGYYIVPSPSTALLTSKGVTCLVDSLGYIMPLEFKFIWSIWNFGAKIPQSYIMFFLYYIMRHSVQIGYWILIYIEYFGTEILQSYMIFHTIFFYHRSLLYNEAFWHIKQCKISKAEELISLPLDDLENYTKVPLSYCDKSHFTYM